MTIFVNFSLPWTLNCAMNNKHLKSVSRSVNITVVRQTWQGDKNKTTWDNHNFGHCDCCFNKIFWKALLGLAKWVWHTPSPSVDQETFVVLVVMLNIVWGMGCGVVGNEMLTCFYLSPSGEPVVKSTCKFSLVHIIQSFLISHLYREEFVSR